MARISKQQLIRLQKTLKTDAAIGKKPRKETGKSPYGINGA